MGTGPWVSEKIKQVAKAPVATAYRENRSVCDGAHPAGGGKPTLLRGLRYNIADPAFAKKVMEGRQDEINRCVGCCRCLDDVLGARAAAQLLQRESSFGRRAGRAFIRETGIVFEAGCRCGRWHGGCGRCGYLCAEGSPRHPLRKRSSHRRRGGSERRVQSELPADCRTMRSIVGRCFVYRRASEHGGDGGGD